MAKWVGALELVLKPCRPRCLEAESVLLHPSRHAPGRDYSPKSTAQPHSLTFAPCSARSPPSSVHSTVPPPRPCPSPFSTLDRSPVSALLVDRLHVQRAAGAARPGPGGGGGGGRPGGGGAVGGGAAGRVLQCDVPDRGGRRVRGDARHPARGPHARALPAPDALPRLLRPGLRRLHHAPVQAGHGGAGRHPEPEHAGLRRHREDQGQARDALPAHRLLRRHHRHGRQRRRLPEQGAVVRRGDRAAGRQRDGGGVRGERPGAAGLQHRRRKTFFSVKSLTAKDIVVLFGSHSIGTSHCEAFQKRLYNFTGAMDQDPSLDAGYARQLRKLCPRRGGRGRAKVPMDPGSGFTFDLSYYRHVLATGGLFQSDGSLLHDAATKGYVQRMANASSPDEYYQDFAAAMVKMGRTDVLPDHLGEVRATCGVFVDWP